MLDELSKNNDLWYKMAFYICGDSDLAKDLVQDMYLKLYEVKKEINAGYVYFTLRNIFLDNIKKNSARPNMYGKYCNYLVDADEYLKNNLYIVDEYDFDNDKETQIKIDLINDELEQTKLVRKLIVKYSVEDGLRKFSRESGINKSTVQKHRNEFKKQIWQRKQKG